MSINPYILPGLGGLSENFIKRIVCSAYAITEDQLLLPRRPFIEARYLVMYLASKYLNASRAQLAQMFGKKSHSTACNAIESIDNLLTTNHSFRSKFMEIDASLRALRGEQTIKKYRQKPKNIDSF